MHPKALTIAEQKHDAYTNIHQLLKSIKVINNTRYARKTHIYTRENAFTKCCDFSCMLSNFSTYMTIEKILEARLRSEVKKLGGIAIKYASQTSTGYPDRLVLMPGGKVYLIELKSGLKAVISPLQALQIRNLKHLGFDARVIRTREALDLFLQEIEKQL